MGHGIAWLNHDSQGEVDFLEPPPGCFSNQEIVEEVKDYPIQPLVLLWYLLAKVEYRNKVGDAIFKQFEKRHKQAPILASKVGYADLRVGHSLRNMALEDLVPQFMESLGVLRAYAAEQQLEKGNFSDTEAVIGILFAALVKLVGQNQLQSVPLNKWREDIVKYGPLDESLKRWLDSLERSLNANHFDLITTLKDGSAPEESRLVAALLLSASDTPDPEERFYANVILTTTMFYETWLLETEDVVNSLISEGWLRVTQYERFFLTFSVRQRRSNQ